mgnify:CR=1 FL=1
MATTYIPKTSLLSPLRIGRITKKLIDECNDDRERALETHRFFRQLVDENPQDGAAKALMVECLKVAQTSKNHVTKLLNLAVKLEEIQITNNETSKATGKKASSVFSELDTMLND